MRRYGHTNSADVEIVVLHSLATLHTRQPEIARLARAGEDGGKPHLLGVRPIFFLEESRFLDTEIHDRSLLAAGFAGRGPAVIVEYGSSTLVGPRDQYRMGIWEKFTLIAILERPEIATAASIDPVTVEVVRRRLVAISDEVDTNITRTAFSPYIYEYKDYAVGVVDSNGDLICQCTAGMPVFVADVMRAAVQDGLQLSAPISSTRAISS